MRKYRKINRRGKAKGGGNGAPSALSRSKLKGPESHAPSISKGNGNYHRRVQKRNKERVKAQ